ncbi:MAG TPA: hypothetical protein PKW90_04435, partial [Myxococcota bacterium]|nr:hypothetical protein [Myxococcota bacterium]
MTKNQKFSKVVHPMMPKPFHSLLPVGLALLALAPLSASAAGFVVVSGDDADDVGHCSYNPTHPTDYRCGGLYPAFLNQGVTVSNAGDGLSGNHILAIGVNGSSAQTALQNWNNPANGGPGATLTILTSTSAIASVNFADYELVYLPSAYLHTGGGITEAQLAAIAARQADIVNYVNNQGGSILALTEADTTYGWNWLPVSLETTDYSFTLASPTPDMTALSPLTTSSNLSHCCFHNVFSGPSGYSGLDVLAIAGTDAGSYVGLPVILGGLGTKLTAEVCDDG